MNQASRWTDWFGVAASVACAIHCAAMPFVVAFLPLFGLSFLAEEGFHQVMVFVCLAVAAVSFVPGWRRHRRLVPASIATIGLSLIATAAFALEDQCCANCESSTTASMTDEEVAACDDSCCPLCDASDSGSTTLQSEQGSDDTLPPSTASLAVPFLSWITPLGGLLLVSAHLTNRRFICRCGCCPTPSDATPSDVSSEAMPASTEQLSPASGSTLPLVD
ncbi:MAG: MerC domain-containing protein [Planctomycetota bacterium]